MSQQQPIPAQPWRRSKGCEWCIFGPVRWFVVWSRHDEEWEYEHEVCDRCLVSLREAEVANLAHLWTVEEA
jgi:hypothetical protein